LCQNRSDLWSASRFGSTLLHRVEIEVLGHVSHAFELLFARKAVEFVISAHALASFSLVVPEHLFVLFSLSLSIKLSFLVRGVERLVKFSGLHSLLIEPLLILERSGNDSLNELGFHFSHVVLAIGDGVKELKVFIRRGVFIGTIPQSVLLLGQSSGSSLLSGQRDRVTVLISSDDSLLISSVLSALAAFDRSNEESSLHLVLDQTSCLRSSESPHSSLELTLLLKEVHQVEVTPNRALALLKDFTVPGG